MAFTPIDPNILLQLQNPNYFDSYAKGVRLAELMRQAPLQEQQMQMENQISGIKLRDLLDPNSIINQSQALGLQNQQLANQQRQMEMEQAQRTQEAETALAGIAQNYFDPATKQFNAQGFVGEALSKFPMIAADKLLDIANKYRYGFGGEEKAWRPVGGPIKGNDGYYYQNFANQATGETRTEKLDVQAPVVSGQGAKPIKVESDEGTFLVDPRSGRVVSEIKTPSGAPIARKHAPLSAESARSIANAKALRDNLSELKQKMVVGDFAANAASARKPGSDLNRLISDAVDLLGKKRSGAALSQGEEQLYQNLIAGKYDIVFNNKQAFLNQIARLERENNYFLNAVEGKKEEPKQEPPKTYPKANPKYGKAYPDKKGGWVQWTKGGTPNLNDPSGWIRVVK